MPSSGRRRADGDGDCDNEGADAVTAPPDAAAIAAITSILRTFKPGPKNLFANKLFSLFAATMAWSGFDPYHGMWREFAQTKCIGVIPTPCAMKIALGLGVITPQPMLYHT